MNVVTHASLERTELHGLAALSDEELLATLGRMRPAAARRLLESACGLRRLSGWSATEIAAVPGARRSAQAIAAALELGKRSSTQRAERGTALSASADVYRHFRAALGDARREIFVAALLDVKNRLLRDMKISEGSLSASLVHPREAFAPAVREPAHSVIFVHNHPSGDPTPSDEDAALTRRLVAAGDVLGIRVLDHVVLGDGDWYSFADAGRLR